MTSILEDTAHSAHCTSITSSKTSVYLSHVCQVLNTDVPQVPQSAQHIVVMSCAHAAAAQTSMLAAATAAAAPPDDADRPRPAGQRRAVPPGSIAARCRGGHISARWHRAAWPLRCVQGTIRAAAARPCCCLLMRVGAAGVHPHVAAAARAAQTYPTSPCGDMGPYAVLAVTMPAAA
eukprot:CAMPEP_0202859078 /NCGR_PEP_ID=MMETSP1391-20130828/1354_1 /ASSEMBLY_ACC=CAM_ASM_000867 /TAXON_ID=1034604 /ORGANISM="Chlamydomonas leiostraca, Strain SAG 11-49" /LENGTH=176 /DNA_ID=CAMNT_0049538083 /DNA_START=59 /DNA_END=591 /DNA_ORIENTATION=-